MKYTCIKATTTWAGRNYTAWFTKEIPISDGPYKFNLLPGLIVELYDDNKHYHFELLGFEKISNPLKFKLNFKDYIKIDKQKLFEIWKNYKSDPFTYVNDPKTRISPEVHQQYKKAFTEEFKKRNNHIELK